jgi:hypothetical protein
LDFKALLKLTFKLLLACYILSPINQDYAQGKRYNISGVISEIGSAEPLIGANVSIYWDSLRAGAVLRGAATNKYGFYSIPDFPAGTFYFFVSSIGYETKIIQIMVPGNSQRHDFSLAKKTIILNEIIVQDKRLNEFSKTVGSIDINPETVKRLPSFGGEADIFKALQLLPGVTTATEISTGLYVRGGSADQNLTLIDGVNVYNPAHLGGFASTFNADAINNITLIKGAFPAEFGGRLSSVLDITMREGSKEKFSSSIGLNTIGSRITIEGPLDTNASFIISGRKMFLDKILPLIHNLDNIPRYGFYDINGKISYSPSKNDKVFISAFISNDDISDAPSNKDIGYGITWSNATVNLTWTNISSGSLFTNTSLMYTNYSFSTLIKDKNPAQNPLDFFTSSVINDILLKRDMQFFAAEKHSVKTGAEITFHLFSTTTSDFYIPELAYKPFYGTGLNSLEASFYIQDDYQIAGNLKSNIGGRVFYFQQGSFFALEPRISLSYFPLDRLTIRAAFSIAHQTLHMLTRNDIPLPTDLWYPSSKEIQPSRSIQGSLGFEVLSPDRSYLFSLEGYYKDMTHLYEYKDNADFKYGNNIGNQLTEGVGYAYGTELFLNKKIGDFTGWIGYTLAWTRRYFPELNAGIEFYPRYDKRHDISIVLNYEFSNNFNSSATWTYGTGEAFALPVNQFLLLNPALPSATQNNSYYDYSGRDQFRLPAFHKLDLSFNYNTELLSKAVQLSLNIYNAYNHYNAFTKYIGYKIDPVTGDKIPVLRQFTLYPFLPSLGINIKL